MCSSFGASSFARSTTLDLASVFASSAEPAVSWTSLLTCSMASTLTSSSGTFFDSSLTSFMAASSVSSLTSRLESALLSSMASSSPPSLTSLSASFSSESSPRLLSTAGFPSLFATSSPPPLAASVCTLSCMGSASSAWPSNGFCSSRMNSTKRTFPNSPSNDRKARYSVFAGTFSMITMQPSLISRCLFCGRSSSGSCGALSWPGSSRTRFLPRFWLGHASSMHFLALRRDSEPSARTM
mmetsp:Transcript_8271/g.23721  ORF Transcript_8271/g.23721 Transcript_8271/m.23721 type:complete len:240 (+) Transcript_8271:592-1311(+)